MTLRSPIGFALGASAAAMLGAAALFLLSSGDDRLASTWAARGFIAMAVPGVLGGVWLAREHGRSAPRFLLALACGFITRLVLAGSAAFFASRAGGGAGIALLVGLAAGFVPLLAFEMFWFLRIRGAHDLGTRVRG